MRVSRSGSSSSTAGARRSGKAAGGFAGLTGPSTTSVESAPAAMGGAGVSSIGDVSALMALQGVGGPLEKRDRALRKGRRLLDALDRLQLSVLDQNTTGSHLSLLQRAVAENRDQTGDDGLDDALAHIEVRAAVEIAKLEKRRRN